ncbi:hypothetical protein DRP77_11770, partial [Candidatus Poribacteria bacterium]
DGKYKPLGTLLTIRNLKLAGSNAELLGELKRARFKLEEVIIPSRDKLLANYPNPANPETWLPFTLAKGGEVVIRIYDIRGSLIRELKLGRLEPGLYLSRGRAAHWDGRNDRGERVASGIYFYQLIVNGERRAVRKLILGK